MFSLETGDGDGDVLTFPNERIQLLKWLTWASGSVIRPSSHQSSASCQA